MTVIDFLDYLTAHPQTRDLGRELQEIVDANREATLRRSA